MTGISNLTFLQISQNPPEFIYWYLKFEDIRFYNLSVYHYNLHDKQNCIITGSAYQKSPLRRRNKKQ